MRYMSKSVRLSFVITCLSWMFFACWGVHQKDTGRGCVLARCFAHWPNVCVLVSFAKDFHSVQSIPTDLAVG